MNRAELIIKLQDRSPNLAAATITASTKLIFNKMTAALAQGERVELRGFGAFSLRHCKSRMARNPKTGAPVQVPEKYRVYFRPSKDLNMRINQQSRQKNVSVYEKL